VRRPAADFAGRRLAARSGPLRRDREPKTEKVAADLTEQRQDGDCKPRCLNPFFAAAYP
jgi:hypothetical protein